MTSHQDRATGAQLRRAAGSQSLDTLKDALRGWTLEELNEMASEDGKNVVHMAAWQGCVENLAHLLDMGCNLDVIATGDFSFGKTPIFFATTRCRDDVVLFLLERGAKVKIVNNKGQSVLSLAASHLRASTVSEIRKKEVEQADMEWSNFRASHSDGLEYGDLEPRFLERPVRDTDIVKDFVINPTTKQSRKGSFLRRHPHKQPRAQKQKPPKPKRKPRPTPTLSIEDKARLNHAWKELEEGQLRVESLLEIVEIYESLKKPWISNVSDRLRDVVRDHTQLRTLVESSRDVLDERQLRLLERVLTQVSCPSSTPVRRIQPRPRLTVPSLEYGCWYDACQAVTGLSVSTLDNGGSILSLSRPPTFVDTIEGLREMNASLLHQPLVAFDTEWASNISNGGSLRVSTIQLAVQDQTWVVDLLCPLDSYQEQCRKLVKELFRDVIMLGFALGRDIPALEKWLGEPLLLSNCIDLQLLWAGRGDIPGLAACAKEFCSTPLSKAEQCSDWSQRPLSDAQLMYAGLDAGVLSFILAEKANQIG